MLKLLYLEPRQKAGVTANGTIIPRSMRSYGQKV